MLKSIFVFTLFACFFQAAFAQKDTAVYYLKRNGKVVSVKDSADFILAIFPPDTNVDKSLFIVKEFYTDGKLKLAGGSKSNNVNKLMFQGAYIAFYENGHKMLIRNYENGKIVGDEFVFYPNGKLYNIKSYAKDGSVFLKQCNDSTGSVLAENGKGKWKEYNENFKEISAEGEIDNGVEEGAWHGKVNDFEDFESVFQKGKLISSVRIDKYKQDTSKKNKPDTAKTYSKVDEVPEFPGGLEAFGKFLGHYIRYPLQAVKNGTQGRVIISFVVERDGSLTNVKAVRGIGDGCDEEAVRVMEMSPHWKPGMQAGRPVRVAYSVPVSFKLH